MPLLVAVRQAHQRAPRIYWRPSFLGTEVFCRFPREARQKTVEMSSLPPTSATRPAIPTPIGRRRSGCCLERQDPERAPPTAACGRTRGLAPVSCVPSIGIGLVLPAQQEINTTTDDLPDYAPTLPITGWYRSYGAGVGEAHGIRPECSRQVDRSLRCVRSVTW